MREKFSDDEWATVLRAPAAVISAVIGSSLGGPVSIMKEVGAAVNSFEQAAKERRENPLIAEILVALKERFDAFSFLGNSEGDTTLGDVDVVALGSDPAKAVAMVREAGEVLNRNAPGPESDEYRTWLLQIGRNVAEAAPEGGFMGIGGEQVNDAEREILAQLREALGLSEQAA
ncbi:MAG: hypothetical protein HC822_18005 [Oscillochloris sp.]|nr:hypothetical protein [Oscillochloris sp.]